MAWVTEYDLGWHSPNKNGTIYIQRDGASYVSPLELAGGSLEIKNSIGGWEEHVARMNCSFTIVNNLSDFYELMPLMTISAGQVRVIVTNDSYQSEPVVIFEGFINCEAVSQDMLNFADLTLTASGLLSKLQFHHPVDVDTIQYMSLIDIIDSCLTMTGSAYPIYVNCDLYEVNAALSSGQTLFNRTALHTELFWKNNIERVSALDILEAILKSFNCYLCWSNQRWYINHYPDLNETRTYVVYSSGVSYGYADTGGTSSPGLLLRQQIHGSPLHKQVGFTQVLSVIPGLQQLDIKSAQKDFFNLINPDLSNFTRTAVAEPTLDRREWLAYDDALPTNWALGSERMKDINNAVRRWSYDITHGSNQMNGLTTRFTTSTNGFDTELIITFKFGLQFSHHLCDWYTDGGVEFRDSPELTTITFYWYLCTYETVIANRDFFWLNPSVGYPPKPGYEYVVDGDVATNFNILEITAADLDKDLYTYTGTLKIPIGALVSDSSGDSDDLDLCFRMGTEMVSKDGETPEPAGICYYGDFKASVSGQPENNLLRGDITTDFLDKMVIEIDLFDSGWNYRNGLIRPTGINYLTQLWTYGGGSNTLAEILMKAKFQLYRVARQKIEMTIHEPYFPEWSILWPWEDSKQSNKVFISLSVTHRPQSDMLDVILYEYDATEVINLV